MKNKYDELENGVRNSLGACLVLMFLIGVVLFYFLKDRDLEINHPLSKILEENNEELFSLGIKEMDLDLNISNLGKDMFVIETDPLEYEIEEYEEILMFDGISAEVIDGIWKVKAPSKIKGLHFEETIGAFDELVKRIIKRVKLERRWSEKAISNGVEADD